MAFCDQVSQAEHPWMVMWLSSSQYGVLQSDGEVDLKLIDHYVRKILNQSVQRWD